MLKALAFRTEFLVAIKPFTCVLFSIYRFEKRYKLKKPVSSFDRTRLTSFYYKGAVSLIMV